MKIMIDFLKPWSTHRRLFCWNSTEQIYIISKQVERKKIDQMKLPEKLTYTLPTSDASSMKMFAKLLNGSFETLLETEQLKVNLSLVSNVSSFNCTCYTCWLTIGKRHLFIIYLFNDLLLIDQLRPTVPLTFF